MCIKKWCHVFEAIFIAFRSEKIVMVMSCEVIIRVLLTLHSSLAGEVHLFPLF